MGRFMDQLKHAFALKSAKDDACVALPESLDRLARAVVERGMEMPAIAILESMRPLNFLASQTMHAAWPLVCMVGLKDDYRAIANALEDRETLHRMAARIEALSSQQRNRGVA